MHFFAFHSHITYNAEGVTLSKVVYIIVPTKWVNQNGTYKVITWIN